MKALCYCLFSLSISKTVFSQITVTTQHNDLNRTGWNSQETRLHTRNVKTGTFGMLFAKVVDDQIYVQPLVARVNIAGAGFRNVVIVATVNNTVYAFDADSVHVGNAYWQKNLSPVGARAAKNTDMTAACGAYNDFSGNMGIPGTPVIDPATNTLYVVAKSFSTGAGYQQYLHSIDISTGAEKNNSPKLITAQVTGNGDGSMGGKVNFDPWKQNQRPGLLLLNGIVYIGWASHGDCDPYHGWILGYDEITLDQKIIYNATSQGYKGGIWMAGAGLAADDLGNIYAAVGNGSVGFNNNPSDVANRSESALKLTPSGSSLTVSSFFTPNNYPALEASDLDFGVTGILLIPGTNRALAGVKDGAFYLMNRDNMGGYDASANQVIQSFAQGGNNAHNITSLTYYKGTQHEYVYTWSENTALKAFPFNRTINQFDLQNLITSSVQGPVGYNGAFLSVSSNGAVDSTAILWTSYSANGNANQATRPGILRAFSANDITKELWNSSMTPRDNPGNYAKFSCPTIANGKVYLATFSNQLIVYGLMTDYVTGLPERTRRTTLLLYPNPAKDVVKISLGEEIIKVMNVFDNSGKLVFTETKTAKGVVDLPLAGISGGLYMVEVRTDTDVFRQKLVIHK